MPTRAPRICSCGLKVAHGAICICRQRRKAEADRKRPGARQRGYSTAWDKARAAYLKEYPRCARCGAPASHVDHIIAHGGDRRIFWNKDNWQALCQSCHSRKTAARDGGFGNPRGVVGNLNEGDRDRGGPSTRKTPELGYS